MDITQQLPFQQQSSSLIPSQVATTSPTLPIQNTSATITESVLSHLQPTSTITLQDLEKFWSAKQKEIKQFIEVTVNRKLDAEVKKAQRKQMSSSNHKRNNVNNFGQEVLDYILKDIGKLIKAGKGYTNVLQTVIRMLYFTPEQKCNHNIYIIKGAVNCAAIYKDGAWGMYPIEWAIARVVQRGNDVLQHYLLGDNENLKVFAKEIGKAKMEQLKEFTDMVDNIEDYNEQMESIYRDTEHTILQYQHLAFSELRIPEVSDV